MSGPRDVVDDDRVEALSLELATSVVDRVGAVLGRETDDHLARTPAGRQCADRTSSVCSSSIVGGRARSFLSLSRRRRRAGSRRRRRPSQARRRRRNSPRAAPRPARRRSGPSMTRTPGGGSSARLAAISVTSAPRRAASRGEREAHPARRAIADEADAVDRLAGASSGHEHPQARPGPGARGVTPGRWTSSASHASSSSAGSASRPTPRSPWDASSPSPGGITVTPRSRSSVDVRLGGGVQVHAVVHRRRDDDRACRGERGGRQQVVGVAVRELGDRVGAGGRDQVTASARSTSARWLIGARSGAARRGRHRGPGRARTRWSAPARR